MDHTAISKVNMGRMKVGVPYTVLCVVVCGCVGGKGGRSSGSSAHIDRLGFAGVDLLEEFACQQEGAFVRCAVSDFCSAVCQSVSLAGVCQVGF